MSSIPFDTWNNPQPKLLAAIPTKAQCSNNWVAGKNLVHDALFIMPEKLAVVERGSFCQRPDPIASGQGRGGERHFSIYNETNIKIW